MSPSNKLALSKGITSKRKFSRQSISQYFETLDFFSNFPFTTMETIITYKNGINEFSHELLKDLKLRILGNYEMSGKCLNFIE